MFLVYHSQNSDLKLQPYASFTNFGQVQIDYTMVSQIVVHDSPGSCLVLENDLKYSCIYAQLRKSV
jgi:hypothetical protein